MNSILIINGPNLNMLGLREQAHYGSLTWNQVEQLCENLAIEMGLEIETKQSNSEGTLVDYIQQAPSNHQGIILNAGAFTHTSIALVDAINAVNLPVVEVHMSNIYAREEFRKHSYISPVAIGGIYGFGPDSYLLALRAIDKHLKSQEKLT